MAPINPEKTFLGSHVSNVEISELWVLGLFDLAYVLALTHRPKQLRSFIAAGLMANVIALYLMGSS